MPKTNIPPDVVTLTGTQIERERLEVFYMGYGLVEEQYLEAERRNRRRRHVNRWPFFIFLGNRDDTVEVHVNDRRNDGLIDAIPAAFHGSRVGRRDPYTDLRVVRVPDRYPDGIYRTPLLVVRTFGGLRAGQSVAFTDGDGPADELGVASPPGGTAAAGTPLDP